jgi:hypothetical protein
MSKIDSGRGEDVQASLCALTLKGTEGRMDWIPSGGTRALSVKGQGRVQFDAGFVSAMVNEQVGFGGVA